MPYSTLSRQPFQVEQHRTLEETTYQYLRAAIVAGELAPGTKLVGSRLAAELNVSRITIANALKRLISEGFVLGAPHREAIVASLDEASLREIFLTRYALEDVVMREAVKHTTPAILDQLRAIDVQLRLSIAGQDVVAYRRLEREYHLLIYATSRLPMITALLSDLWDRLEPYRGRRLNNLQLSHQASEEHNLILHALEARDSTRMIAAMRAHVDHGYERFRQALATANLPAEASLSLRRTAARRKDRIPVPAGSLAAAFDVLADKRRGQGKVHPYGGILALAVCAMLCGARSRYAVAQWGQQCHPAIRVTLGLAHDRGPSIATMHRVFRDLDEQRFLALLQAWLEEQGINQLERQEDQFTAQVWHAYRWQDRTNIAILAMLEHVRTRVRVALAEDAGPHHSDRQQMQQMLLHLFAGTTVTAHALLAQRELVRQIVAQAS
jgi:DNA-binding GntR family transcriptional regulator